MAADLEAPPVLSTPDSHILNQAIPASTGTDLSEEQLFTQYEIQRTLDEIRSQRWQRIALQFPDEMLHNAPRVYQQLSRGLVTQGTAVSSGEQSQSSALQDGITKLVLENQVEQPRLFILADTSYGSCCVDEVAAEHVDADAVIHYGRACLSPTARLPVVHVFTQPPLDLEQVTASFMKTFPERKVKVLLTADMPYAKHVSLLYYKLQEQGYDGLFAAEIVHDPSSPIPNRTVPNEVHRDPDALASWSIYHLSQPPTSLLLTLSSRVQGFYIFPTDSASVTPRASASRSTTAMLRRRYALVTSLATVGIWGILINTLSVKNYMHIVDHVKNLISSAGKKSYLFVVGKLNAAKVANFSEIGGWVVIGCWESSLVDSQDFYRPLITPFELQLALNSDSDRVWTGRWRSDFQAILDSVGNSKEGGPGLTADGGEILEENGGCDSEPESAPPEFDLRTGKYVSNSRPMLSRCSGPSADYLPSSSALIKKGRDNVIAINGTVSPGAAFLREKRTWQGLGSDFQIQYDDSALQVREGRSGIARGYTVGNGPERR